MDNQKLPTTTTSHIYNCDEFVLFYSCLPDKTLTFKGDKCFGSKTSNERLTVLVGCNADGCNKLPLFVIGKFKKPRCFKNVIELTLQYDANKSAWMTSELFLMWLKNMDQYFQKRNKKIALILITVPHTPP